MKKLILLLLITCCFTATAQNLEDIKSKIILMQYNNAKKDIDNAMNVASLAQNPQTWLMRSCIYIALYKDAATPKDQSATYFTTATSAFEKYKILDPSYNLLSDKVLSNAVVMLYGVYYEKGVQYFNTKDWQGAYTNFAAAVDMGDILIAQKISAISFDTTSIMYAGASAQNLKEDANATKFYKRLADKNMGGKDLEFAYQFLCNYYMRKKEEANYQKYTAIAKALYPQSTYFALLEKDHEYLKDPYNSAMQDGEDLYFQLNPLDGSIPQIKNTSDLEQQLVVAFDKAARLNPDKAGYAYTYIGNHFLNKSIATGNKIRAIETQLKSATGVVKKALDSTRNILYSNYDSDTYFTIRCYDDAATAFGKKTVLDEAEKKAYKEVVNYLVSLHAEKKEMLAQSKPKDAAFHGEKEKKWAAVYEQIK